MTTKTPLVQANLSRFLGIMKLNVVILSLTLLSAMNVSASDKEKSTYVGGGRYIGEGRSIDDAVLRQRNNEYSERERDRQDNEQRYDRSERREREYDRESHQDYESSRY
ncbi:MAG: hypothetical protein ABIN99_12465 [Nitrosospira sp.]